jgi:hypothetical protein
LIKAIGPVLIEKKIDKIIQGIIALLQGQDNFVDDD